jgi:1,2-diacylglycerol 3-alpha-glucosyltransferase
MRILMTSHGYPPTLSGVTLVVQKLARAMVQRGHQVTVVTGVAQHPDMSSRPKEGTIPERSGVGRREWSDAKDPYEADDQGVRLIRIRGLVNPFWKEAPIPHLSAREMDAIVAQVRPDLLHAHEAAVLGFQTQRAAHSLGLPAVTTCYYVPRFVARYLTWDDEPQGLVEALAWGYTTWIFNQFDHVVFATEAHRQIYLQHGLEAPTSIISNGLDITRYHPAGQGDAEVEARYHLPPHPRILFVSRLAKDKEIDILIRAMAHLTAEAHLLLVGRGQDRDQLEELASELDLRARVHFVGFVPEADLPALYRACDLFVITATTEVQSLPTLQAAATGLPVVAADALALPELVADGINGFLVPPGDPLQVAAAMARILNDPDLAARMGQASLAIARPHAESHTFDQYEALYRQMIEAARRP